MIFKCFIFNRNRSCIAPRANGKSCVPDSDCASGHCCGVVPFKKCRECCKDSHCPSGQNCKYAQNYLNYILCYFYSIILLIYGCKNDDIPNILFSLEIESALLLEQMGNHVVLTLTVHPVTAVVYGLSKDVVNVVRIHIAREENSV